MANNKKLNRKMIGALIGALVLLVVIIVKKHQLLLIALTPRVEPLSAPSMLAVVQTGYVSEAEVQDVIARGRINKRKSNPRAKPCPVIAIEKKTVDNQTVRVVYGRCSGKNKVITVIDLDTDHDCNCR